MDSPPYKLLLLATNISSESGYRNSFCIAKLINYYTVLGFVILYKTVVWIKINKPSKEEPSKFGGNKYKIIELLT